MNNSKDELLAIAKEFKTPLYIFDEEELCRRVGFVQDNLGSNLKLCYAVKANPFILPSVAPLVERIECCSAGEHEIAMACNIAPGQLVISGITKDLEVIQQAANSEGPALRYTAESPDQCSALAALGEAQGVSVNVLLRLSSGNQFGMDAPTLTQMVDAWSNNPWINLCGIQFFSGTQKGSLKKVAKELETIQNLVAELRKCHHFEPAEIEYGPGFAVDYFDGLSLAEKDARDSETLKEFSELIKPLAAQMPIHIELGRFLAASCGTYITKVLEVKETEGENFAIVDGGIHQLVYYGNALALKKPPCSLLNPAASGRNTYTLCGSLCTVNDILAKRLELPTLSPSSLIAFHHCGAYSVTEAMALFLSRDIPAVVLKGKNEVNLLRHHSSSAPFNSPAPFSAL